MSTPQQPPLPAPPARYPFETRPLTDPVDPNAVRAFEDDLRRRFSGVGGSSVLALVLIGLLLVPMLLIALTILGAIVVSFANAGFGAIAVPFVLIALTFVALLVWLIVRMFRRGPADHRYRLDAFARANAMEYLPVLPQPNLPGLIFHSGSDRKATDLLRGTQPRFVEFANYQYTTSNGENSSTHHWGYVAIHIGTPLPHIVLDAVGNNGLLGSNLPASFDKHQHLSLEGDFDRYFTLYCPQGYERDALYLFTPDIMVRFMDTASQLDVEIVDEWLFLYTQRPVSTTDPASWAWLFSAVSALMDKLAQWERWRDERYAAELAAQQAPAPSYAPAAHAVAGAAPLPFHTTMAAAPPPPQAWLGPKGVARPGRRLKGRFPWLVVVLVGVILLMVAVPMLLIPALVFMVR